MCSHAIQRMQRTTSQQNISQSIKGKKPSNVPEGQMPSPPHTAFSLHSIIVIARCLHRWRLYVYMQKMQTVNSRNATLQSTLHHTQRECAVCTLTAQCSWSVTAARLLVMSWAHHACQRSFERWACRIHGSDTDHRVLWDKCVCDKIRVQVCFQLRCCGDRCLSGTWSMCGPWIDYDWTPMHRMGTKRKDLGNWTMDADFGGVMHEEERARNIPGRHYFII